MQPCATDVQKTSNGLALLEAASIALLSDGRATDPAGVPSGLSSTCGSSASPGNCGASLRALLNPAPAASASVNSLPTGFVLGKDGKIKKKRGRKPTPGLTDEDRRQARLLKNRRTAEVSRRRKLALMRSLTEQRDDAKKVVQCLRDCNEYLVDRLAGALGVTVATLLKNDRRVAACCNFNAECPPHSDVSTPGSVVDSDDDRSLHYLPAPSTPPTRDNPPVTKC